MEALVEYLARGFLIMLAISMPCVLIAAGIGLVIGILQAVTQVQEQTIAAAPKILGVFLIIVIGGMGFINMLKGFFNEGMAIAFNHITKVDDFALASDYFKYTSPFEGEMTDKFKNVDDINYIMKHPGKVPFIDNQQKMQYTPNRATPMPQPDFNERKQILGR
ncbi:MAG: flagellar biosynthetic protein FliQ [Clostridiaceae bacterium]|jgi:type III secretory pathway component EscS|nr:flagellar biosynthetic protein FliQ [Clostridiaceae bacterium]